MSAPTATSRRPSVGLILIIISIGLWATTVAWMWLPDLLFGIEGQIYLYPIALFEEAIVVVLALIALVFAIMDAARHRARGWQTATVIVGVVAMLTVGPVLLWFGGTPLS